MATRALQCKACSPWPASPQIRFVYLGSRFTLHASSPRSVALTQLRFACLAVASSAGDLHPEDRAHAERTLARTAARPSSPPRSPLGQQLKRQSKRVFKRTAQPAGPNPCWSSGSEGAECRDSKLPCGSLDGTRKPSSARLRPGRARGSGIFNLETAVGRARVGRHGVRWQGQAQACPALRLGRTTRAHCPLGGATRPACARAAQSGV